MLKEIKVKEGYCGRLRLASVFVSACVLSISNAVSKLPEVAQECGFSRFQRDVSS